jgi:hypothetical protein
MSFFDDSFSGDNFGNTLMSTASGAATGFIVGGGPAGAVAGASIGFMSANQQARQERKGKAAEEDARKQAELEATARQNALLKKEFESRKSGGGTGMRSPGQQNASNQGTILTSGAGASAAPQSILGGS